VLGGGRSGRASQQRRCLAAWFAALLAIAPFMHPAVPVHLAAVAAASAESPAAYDDGMIRPSEPATLVPSAQPSNPGILARLPWVETTLELSPAKSPPLRMAAEPPVLASQARAAFSGEIGRTLQRSAVWHGTRPNRPTLLNISV
jgi:hypothetical protein